MQKAIAEFIGTFALVFIGCGTVVVGGMATGSTAITELAIALAFGLTIVAMAYGIGQISGCHVNPAVSLGVYTGRMTLEEKRRIPDARHISNQELGVGRVQKQRSSRKTARLGRRGQAGPISTGMYTAPARPAHNLKVVGSNATPATN